MRMILTKPSILTGLVSLLGVAVVAACLLAACATGPASSTTAQPSSVAAKPQKTPTESAKVSREHKIQQAYDSIRKYVDQGQPDKAIAEYEAADLSNSGDPKAQMLLAELYLAAEHFTDAEKILGQVLSRDPNNLNATYDMALAAGGAGDGARQETLLKKVIAAAPDEARAHASLGDIYLAKQEYGGAEHEFQFALKYDPKNVTALIGLGNAYMYQGHLDRADKVLSKAIEVAPNNSFAYVSRGQERADNGDYPGAEKDLDEAIKLDPNYAWHYLDRGRVRARAGKAEGAIADFTKAISLDPSVFLTYAYRGQIYQQLDKNSEALADYQKALAMRPDYYPVYGLTGELYFMNKQWTKSAAMFEKAYAASPDDFSYPLIAALCYKFKGDKKQADAYLSRVIDKFSRSSLYYQMARFYLQPHNDTYVFQRIMHLKDKILKAKMLFFLGAQYDLNGQKDLAQTVLLDVPDQRYPQLIESRLASWLVHGQGTAKK